MDSTIKRLVPIPEARKLLGDIGNTTIYRLFGRGDLVKVNVGRRSFVTSESLEAYITRITDGSAATHSVALGA